MAVGIATPRFWYSDALPAASTVLVQLFCAIVYVSSWKGSLQLFMILYA